MPSLPIAVLQFTPDASSAANVARIAEAAATASARGTSLLVAPEYSSFFVPEFGQAFVDAAEPLDGPFVTGLSTAADTHRCTIVAGMAEAAADEPSRFRNTLVVVAPERGLIATYRKVHLYDAFGATESDWILPGDPAQTATIDVDGVRIGLQTCYDLRFPEQTRRLAIAGAEVVLVPAEWVRGPGKEHHWWTLMTARAIENTVWTVGAGQAPPTAIGNSLVVDPAGVVRASLGAEPGLLFAEIDTEDVRAVRERNPALALRRYDVHER